MLTSEQREQFLAEGHIIIKGAFPREESLQWVREECAWAGYDVDDPQTWRKGYERMDLARHEPLATYAPAAWQASCDLMGGEDRVKNRPAISLFAMNFKQGADTPYQPPSAQSRGWHKDGWHFRHFLDSPEQGLLGIPLFTDVLPQGGATFLAVDSVPVIARYLAAHPEGVGPDDFDTQALLAECHDFREATGEAGDVYLLHPLPAPRRRPERLAAPPRHHQPLLRTERADDPEPPGRCLLPRRSRHPARPGRGPLRLPADPAALSHARLRTNQPRISVMGGLVLVMGAA